MSRIAFVCQRYGMEVNGGAEYYTRLMAERLGEQYQIEVLTTKAIDYWTWKNEYSHDVEMLNNIIVRRFPSKRQRNRFGMAVIIKLLRSCKYHVQWLEKLWIKAQGPYVPDLINYIKDNKDSYDLFIFVTYLYYPTVFGMPIVSDKAIFVPTAHDEECIYFNIFSKLFKMPKHYVFLTNEERNFVEKTFGINKKSSSVIGIGIDVPDHVDSELFRNKFHISSDYVIYIGRVESGKGCSEMFEYFCKYNSDVSDLKLVVVGKRNMDIPDRKDIVYLGYLSDEDKFNGLAGARALWLPSEFESLSISLLEAMALGVPVIANGKCDVLRGHCACGGGICYRSYDEFEKAIAVLYSKKYMVMQEKAKDYVANHYSWDKVLSDFKVLIDLLL